MTAAWMDPRYMELLNRARIDVVPGTRSSFSLAGGEPPFLLRLTSDQVGIPAELKHINKRRKRNQQGLPQ
jgi:hypothetical protein